MKLKNRDIAEKLKDAFKRAGVELPANKNKNLKKESRSSRKNYKSGSRRKRKCDDSIYVNKDGKYVEENRAFNKRKIEESKRNVQAMDLSDGLPSSDAIRDAYGSSARARYENNRANSRASEKTYLKTKKGVKFEAN
ncbi:MAG: hypothetical protein VYE54_09285, partial [Pseudomonadota bacterium]|nr:hypothetical protein [Pseudomonadota bacterium]